MECVIFEKIKMLKMIHFPCNHGNQSVGVAKYEKPYL